MVEVLRHMLISTVFGILGGQTEETLASLWDYVCYGKVYKHHDPGDGQNM